MRKILVGFARGVAAFIVFAAIVAVQELQIKIVVWKESVARRLLGRSRLVGAPVTRYEGGLAGK